MNFILERQTTIDKVPFQKLAKAHQIFIVISVARNWLHYVNPQGEIVNRLFPTEKKLWAFLQFHDMQAFVPTMTPLLREISSYARKCKHPVFVARNTQFMKWVHYVTETGEHRTRCFPSVEDQETFVDGLRKFAPDRLDN